MEFDYYSPSEMCNFFDKRGYPASVVQAGHHRAQQIDRQSALQTSRPMISDRSQISPCLHGSVVRLQTGPSHSCRFSNRNE